MGPYPDAMIDHDKNVGTVLDKIKELGIADNTIVMYSTDNGPHMNSWPDAAMTPFRNEKNSNWEGAYRVPAMVRWPGQIKPGIGLQRHHLASRLDADPARRGRRARRHREAAQGRTRPATMTYKVHLDGYNLLPCLTGADAKSPRKEFFYFSDDGDLTGLRYDNWKFVFAGAAGTRHASGLGRTVHARFAFRRSSTCASTPMSAPAITSNTYYDWLLDHAFMLVPAQRLRREISWRPSRTSRRARRRRASRSATR